MRRFVWSATYGGVLCACLVAAVMLLAGCEGGGDGEGKVTITVWDWHAADPSKGVGLWLMQIDEAFGRQHPDLRLKHVAQSHNEYYQIFKAAAAAQSGPDVVMLHQGVRIVDQSGSLLPLTDLVTPELKKKLVGWDLTSEGFDPDGTPYAVPIAVQGLLWYYNKAVLKEAGLDPEKVPQSWADFLAACEAVAKAGKAGIAVGEKEGHWAEWFVNSAALQALSPDEQRRLRDGELKWTDPKVAVVFARLKELNDRGCFQKGFMSTSLWPDARYVFLRGQAAFFLGLISDVAHWKEFSQHLGAENVGVMTCPVFKPGPGADAFPIGGAFAYAVTKWAKHPKEAFAYIACIASDANARTFLTDVGSFPANQAVDRGLFTDPTAQKIVGWIDAGKTGPQMTGNMPLAVGDAIKRECQRLLSGQADVPSALEAIEAAAAASRAR